jgi:hypothetical protein
MTLNQIIRIIQSQAQAHKMVNKVAVGADYDFAVDEVKYYPIVWIIPNGFNFSTDNRTVDYQFAIMVMDRKWEDDSNTIDVLSDSAGIILDIVTLLRRYVANFEMIVNGTATPFFDSSTDVVAGHAIDFTIRTPYLESYCEIPV